MKDRLISVSLVGATALLPILIAALVHPPFREYLTAYISNHAKLVGFAPSAIVVYYLLLFGAGPAAALACLAFAIPRMRREMFRESDARRALLSGVVFFAVPIIFYSIFGQLKALRFFAVTFPLVAVPVGAALNAMSEWVIQQSSAKSRVVNSLAVALAIAAAIVVGSDGPARHLRYTTGFELGLLRLESTSPKDGTVSSFLWPVVQYGWRVPSRESPFLLWGLIESDKWVVMDSVLDRVTTEGRQKLAGDASDRQIVPWANAHRLLAGASTALFSIPNDFYASDYFLSENVVSGIPVLRRWQKLRRDGRTSLEFRVLDPEKARLLR